MAGNFKLNYAGFRKLRTSPEVIKELERRGRNIAAAAGEGMEVSTFVGRNRARVSVITASPAARRREAKNRALTRALDAGRN